MEALSERRIYPVGDVGDHGQRESMIASLWRLISLIVDSTASILPFPR
jgi:hypothetical protein